MTSVKMTVTNWVDENTTHEVDYSLNDTAVILLNGTLYFDDDECEWYYRDPNDMPRSAGDQTGPVFNKHISVSYSDPDLFTKLKEMLELCVKL